MKRKDFLSLIGTMSFSLLNHDAMSIQDIQPEKFYFNDDGRIPNSKLPLLIYRKAVSEGITASQLQRQFAANNWTNSWDNGIYSYHHYHSTTHEVLGVYAGSALLHLGGETGKRLEVAAGDIIIIPAGVGHKKLESAKNFGVVGAYPEGKSWDLLKGEPGERPEADKNIARVPIPSTDPLMGKSAGLTTIWS